MPSKWKKNNRKRTGVESPSLLSSFFFSFPLGICFHAAPIQERKEVFRSFALLSFYERSFAVGVILGNRVLKKLFFKLNPWGLFVERSGTKRFE